MKTTFLFIAAAFLMNSAIAQTTKWTMDAAHSKIGFSVDHMVISEVDGFFNKYAGSILSDKPDFSDAKVEFTIEVSSINTDNADRDNHLKSADFFDAAKFPQIVFKGSTMKKVAEGKYQLSGNLTMHGVTKPVVLDVKYNGTRKDPWGNTKAGFKISGALNRAQWGLVYNAAIEAGGVLIGEEVRINCNIELSKQP